MGGYEFEHINTLKLTLFLKFPFLPNVALYNNLR